MSNETLDARGRPRVVITGMGMLSPLGNTVEESWENMIAGRSGITRITQFDAGELPTQIAGEVKNFVPRDYMDFKEARRMSRASQLAVAAARMAVADAGLPEQVPDPDRTGVLVGTAAGGMERAFEEIDTFKERGFRAVSPFGMTMFLCNMPTHHVSLTTGSTGPLSTIVAACATGTQTIGEGAEFIRRGAADMMLAGGVEGLIHVSAIVGFGAMRALSTHFNDAPERASRPFDKDRDGFIIGEGAGVLVLEELEFAKGRGARIYAEIVGYGMAGDSYHITAPSEDGDGAYRVMTRALKKAGLQPSDIDYVNAHGTSTPFNDKLETLAIKRCFGDHAARLAISSTKSMTGHLLGAAGGVEAGISALAVHHQVAPPTINLDEADPECDLDYVPHTKRAMPIRHVLSNSFGFGGTNAALILSRYQE